LPNEAKYGLLNKGGELTMDKKVEVEENMQNQPLIHDFNKESVKSAFTPKGNNVTFGSNFSWYSFGIFVSSKNGVSAGSKTSGGV
jgi:hypothetical protein